MANENETTIQNNNNNPSNENGSASSEIRLYEIIKKHPRILYAVISFFMGCLSMFLMLYFSHRICNKDYVLLFGDGLKTAANIRMCARNILNGESLFYSYSVSLGMNTSLLVAYDFLSPFNLLYVLFYNADENIITALVYILKTGMAAMCFQIFASKTLKCGKFESLLFGVLYSMCAFAIHHGLSNNMWTDAMYLLPLICIGIFKLVKENKYLFLIFVYASSFIINFYMAYNIGIFSFIFFFLLLFTEKDLTKKEKFLRILKYGFGCVIAVLMAACVWMPTLFSIMHYSGEDSSSYKHIAATLLDLVNSLAWGRHEEVENPRPMVYCGIFTYMLLPFFFFNKNIGKRSKIIAGILLAFSLCCFYIKPFYVVIHAFDSPIGFDFRFTYIFSFILCCMASLQFKYIREIKRLFLLFYCFGISVVIVLSQLVFRLYHTENEIDIYLPLISIPLFTIWFLIIYVIARKEPSRLLYFLMIALSVLEVSLNGVVQWGGNYYYTYDSYKIWTFYNNEILDDIRYSSDIGPVRYCLKNDMTDNTDTFFGYNAIDDFGSNDNPHLRLFLQKMGLYTGVHMLHTSGINPVLETLLGVKAIYVGDDPTEVTDSVSSLVKVENPYYASVGFMVNDEAENVFITDSNSFENNNEIIKALTGVEKVFYEVDEKRINYIEDGIKLVPAEDGIIIDRDDSEFPKLLINVDESSEEEDIEDYRVYVQIMFDKIGPYGNANYAILGMENQIGSGDFTLTYSPMIEMVKNPRGYSTIIASYFYEPDIKAKNIYYYSFNGNSMREAYNRIADEQFVVEECRNGYLSGNITVNSDKRLLFLSVPYIDGWKLYLDGKESEITPVVNGDFIGVRLPDGGTHRIELKFTCPWLKEGIIVSVVGVTLYLLLVALNYLFKKEKRRQSGE